MPSDTSRRLVVVGHGMVGHRFLEALVQRDEAAAWQVTVLGEEPRAAYDRIALSSLFTGTPAEDLTLPGPPGGFDPARVRVVTGDAAVAVDRSDRTIRTASGAVHSYDALVLATGSAPFVPPVAGADREGCFVYRTVDDAAAIMRCGSPRLSRRRRGGRAARAGGRRRVCAGSASPPRSSSSRPG